MPIPKKCYFGRSHIDYLRHIISSAGVAADFAKVQAILSWPTPRTPRELQGFLGLTGYYRWFVEGYGMIAKPPTDLLKKRAYQCTPQAEEAFQKLKHRMVSMPVLAMPDFTKTFMLETDASGIGVGAVLMQEGRPIAYFSKGLAPSARWKSVYE